MAMAMERSMLRASSNHVDGPWLEQAKKELELAIRWNRPAILLVIATPRKRRKAGQRLLREWLEQQGQRVELFNAAGKGQGDIPLLLSRKHLRNESVYFVERLAEAGLPALRALNIRREYLIEREIRVVFWLDENEELSIAQSAPDFWAFRHLVVSF